MNALCSTEEIVGADEKKLVRINIGEDFSIMPGPRKRDSGSFSGEEFLEDLLKPKFLEAESNGGLLVVNVDGLYGYPSSFIDASFGQLIRDLGRARVEGVLRVEALHDKFALEEISYCIETADSPRT